MANRNGTSAAPERAPTNPLSRPYWTRAEAAPGDHDAATLAGVTLAIHALARVLANSEAFREIHATSEGFDERCTPLDAPVTEGLFAALYFLSEQAEQLAQPLEPSPHRAEDVPY
jgi:hypothetical protein